MNKSKISTSNLYKFIATSGLVLLIVSLIMSYQLYGDLWMYGIEQLTEYATAYEQMFMYNNFYSSLIDMFLLFIPVSIIMMIYGCVMWYRKEQRYRDRFIKNQADD